MNCLGRFGNCFLGVELMYQPSCLLLCCQGKPGELAEELLSKPQKQFILSLGKLFTSAGMYQDTKWTAQWGLETVFSRIHCCTSPATLSHAAKVPRQARGSYKKIVYHLLNCLSNKLITRTFTSAGDINPGLALVITTRPISLKMTPESCRRSRHRRPGSGDPREILLPAVEVHPERLPGLRTRGRDIPTPQACDVVIVSSFLLAFRDHFDVISIFGIFDPPPPHNHHIYVWYLLHNATLGVGSSSDLPHSLHPHRPTPSLMTSFVHDR